MANYPQETVQDAVCQSHTGNMTGLWFLPARPLRLNTNEWIIHILTGRQEDGNVSQISTQICGNVKQFPIKRTGILKSKATNMKATNSIKVHYINIPFLRSDSFCWEEQCKNQSSSLVQSRNCGCFVVSKMKEVFYSVGYDVWFSEKVTSFRQKILPAFSGGRASSWSKKFRRSA